MASMFTLAVCTIGETAGAAAGCGTPGSDGATAGGRLAHELLYHRFVARLEYRVQFGANTFWGGVSSERLEERRVLAEGLLDGLEFRPGCLQDRRNGWGRGLHFTIHVHHVSGPRKCVIDFGLPVLAVMPSHPSSQGSAQAV